MSARILLAAWLVGCAGSRSAPEGPAPGATTVETPAAREIDPGVPGLPVKAAVQNLQTVHVRAEIGAGRQVELTVENHGAAAQGLASSVRVEKWNGSTWTPVDTSNVHLRDACGVQPLRCLTLAPGASFSPPPWLGTIGEGQCACDECTAAPAGRYRFVLDSCDGRGRVEGEPFEIPGGL